MKSIFKLFFVFLFLLKFNIQNVGAAAESDLPALPQSFSAHNRNLFEVLDRKPAENGLNIINHCLTYQIDPAKQEALDKHYQNQAKTDGKTVTAFLLRKAWDAAQPVAPLTQYLKDSSKRTKGLQELARKLAEENQELVEKLKEVEREKSELAIKIESSMGQPAEAAAPSSKKESVESLSEPLVSQPTDLDIESLRGEVKSLKEANAQKDSVITWFTATTSVLALGLAGWLLVSKLNLEKTSVK